jgi:hypothetical protein
MSALAKCLFLAGVLLTPLLQFAQRSLAPTVEIGGVDIPWRARPEAVVALLKNDRYDIAPVQERSWKVGSKIPKTKACVYISDKGSERNAFTLHFDKKNRLVTVEKNWTPAQGSAVDFAAALYSLVAHRKWGYCMLIPEHDFESEGHGNIINVACDDGGIKISVAQAASPEGKSQVANIYEWVHAPVKKTPGR